MSLRTTVNDYKEAIRVIQDMASGEITETMGRDIILKIAESHPAVLIHARNSIRAADIQFGRLSQETIKATTVAFLKAGRKIPAIKFFRSVTGLGLRQAKDEVDKMQASLADPMRREE